MELVPNAKYPLRLVEADLLKPETWPNAVRHCTYVFHVASPLTFRADEDELVRTAVDGTTNVLQACADAGCIKRVVATNSCASISSGQLETLDVHPITSILKKIGQMKVRVRVISRAS